MNFTAGGSSCGFRLLLTGTDSLAAPEEQLHEKVRPGQVNHIPVNIGVAVKGLEYR